MVWYEERGTAYRGSAFGSFCYWCVKMTTAETLIEQVVDESSASVFLTDVERFVKQSRSRPVNVVHQDDGWITVQFNTEKKAKTFYSKAKSEGWLVLAPTIQVIKGSQGVPSVVVSSVLIGP